MFLLVRLVLIHRRLTKQSAPCIILIRALPINGYASPCAKIIVTCEAAAIIFAFFVNKLFVFNDRSMKLKVFVVQFAEFVSMRLITLALNSVIFWLLIEKLSMNDLIIKAIVSVIVIVLNYIFSKLIIFKNKKDKNNE